MCSRRNEGRCNNGETGVSSRGDGNNGDKREGARVFKTACLQRLLGYGS